MSYTGRKPGTAGVNLLTEGGLLQNHEYIEVDSNLNVTLPANLTVEGTTISIDNASAQTVNLGDNDKIQLGDDDDLQIYHDGSNSIINDNGTGDLQIQVGGSTKLATSSTGVSVTGNITVSGNVDGRDVATDGTKLDGIEASADVTDTANVTAAGALMDSEVTNLAQVKAFDSSDYATAAQGTTADSAVQNLSDLSITASAAELNTLDGITSTVAELNLLDGVTASTAEINKLDGVTATTTEINYTDGVTSNIQTQIDGKASLSGATFTGAVSGTNLTLSGNLTVNGTTSTLNSTNTVITDNLIELNNGVASNANDSGIVIERGSTGDNAFMGWDESADSFIVGTTTATGASTGDFTITAADLTAGTVTADGLTVAGITKVSESNPRLRMLESDTTDLNTQLKSQAGVFGLSTLNDAETSALNRITVDHSTGDISFYEDTGATAKLFWDASAESLGIGTSSPSDLITIQSPASGGGNGLTITRNDNGTDQRVGAIKFGNNVDSDLAMIAAKTSVGNNGDGNLQFYTQSQGGSATERMRIDSSGNLLVGTTTISPTDTDGCVFYPQGTALFTRASDYVLYLNRRTTDGEIVRFTKDGSTVGNIGVQSDDRLTIGCNDIGIGFVQDADAIVPWNDSTKAYVDNKIDLGTSSQGFKDLYLTGAVYIDGTELSGGGGSGTAFYTSSGSFTVPDGVTKVTVFVQGGGGNGYGNVSSGDHGPGGAGAWASKVITTTAGSSISFTVGGSGGTSSCSGVSCTGGSSGNSNTDLAATGGTASGGDINSSQSSTKSADAGGPYGGVGGYTNRGGGYAPPGYSASNFGAGGGGGTGYYGGAGSGSQGVVVFTW